MRGHDKREEESETRAVRGKPNLSVSVDTGQIEGEFSGFEKLNKKERKESR
jgi:hypothetical protein